MTYTHSSNYFFASSDYSQLFWQKWIPEETVRAVMVFQHGLGEHSDRYHNLLEAMQGSGIAFYAMDARGHGKSEGKKGHISSFENYTDDLHQFVEFVKKEQQVDKVVLLGHSLGGAIAASYALKKPDDLQALILSSPAILPYMNSYFNLVKKVTGVMAKYAPSVTVDANLKLKFLSHDQQVIDDYKADPLVHGRASPALGDALFQIHKHLYAQAPDLKLPLLIFHGTADELTDPEGSEKFYQLAGSADKTLKLYEGLYHETMNEIPVAKAEVLRDTRKWLEERI